MNPLNVGSIITLFNNQVSAQNTKILAEITKLQEGEQTEETANKIAELQANIITVKIENVENTPEIMKIKQEGQDKLLTYRQNNGITDKAISDYFLAMSNSEAYSKTFKQLMDEKLVSFGLNDTNTWADLSRESLLNLLQELEDAGILIDFNMQFSAEVQITDLINKIKTELDPDVYAKEVVPELEKFFDLLETLIDSKYASTTNTTIADYIAYAKGIESETSKAVEKNKPELFKLHNYALDFLIQSLKDGSADREVFLEAKKMFDEELNSMKAVAFPGMTNLSNEDVVLLSQNAYEYAAEISGMLQEIQMNGLEDSTLQEMIDDGFVFDNKDLERIVTNNFDKKISVMSLITIFSDLAENAGKQTDLMNRINDFAELEKNGLKLKSNSLYDFIRQFVLTLNSNPKNKVNKIFDILEREETSMKAASNITNYVSDNIREQDLKQAINVLEMIQVVIKSMSTTEVNYADPYGFIASRQNFAKKNGLEDDVVNLVTITSDVASLAMQDIEALKTKLGFVKSLAAFNTGKMMNEQELIRTQMDQLFLDIWKDALAKVNPKFIPVEEINSILASTETNSRKLLSIENSIFEHNKSNSKDALDELLKNLDQVDPDIFSRIDKDVTKAAIKSWDIAVYFATVLATKSEDFHIRSLTTLEGGFNKAPFYTQEFASKIIKASAVNPELFARIYELKRNSDKADASWITIVLGGAGTGKSSTVFGMALENFMQTNTTSNIWLTAPGKNQLDNLHGAITSSVGVEKLNLTPLVKEDLWDKLGLKDLIAEIEKEIKTPSAAENKYISLVDAILKFKLPEGWDANLSLENLPNLLLIDEVTHYSFAELHILSEISRLSYYKDSSNFMKIVGAGDQNQLGYSAEIGGKFYSYNVNSVNAIFTPRLWSTVRPMNNQKRDNNDMFVGITEQLTAIQKKFGDDLNKAKKESEKFLKDVNTITALSYFMNDNTLNGDYITTADNKIPFKTLKNIVSQNPNKTIGVLTKTGQLTPELNKVLSDVGLIEADGKTNIKLYTPDSVQGSEVDYFIFDSNLIDKYDKVRDNVKAFYTYMSRAKNGTIILDPDSTLETRFGIVNGDKASYTEQFEILTDEVIKKAKERRKTDLKELLGNDYKTSDSDNFKWKTGDATIEEVSDSIDIPTRPGFVDYEDNSEKSEKTEENTIKKKAEAGDFRYMLHSFYSNPNADIKGDSIIVDQSKTPTDLNLKNSLASGGKEVIAAWSKLSTDLLHNLADKGTISSKDYAPYLKHIFTEASDFKNRQTIETELILTATTYDSVLNAPYKKVQPDVDKQLKNGDPLLNLSVKLTFGDAVHYITLATFGKPETLKKAVQKYVTDAADAEELVKKIDNKMAQISNALSADSSAVLELTGISASNVDFLTSLRLLKFESAPGKRVSHSLIDLKEDHPKLYTSEVRFFPSTLEKFTALMNNYTFGPKRSDARVAELFALMKNKPYIVMSYKNDINGSKGTDNYSKLVPIGAESRSYQDLLLEVSKLRTSAAEEINAEFSKLLASGLGKEEARGKIVISESLNAKAETLLNRSQIIDMLIKWAKKPHEGKSMIDLFNKEITFNAVDEIYNKSNSISEVLNNFRSKSKEGDTLTKFKQVIEEVKLVINDPEFAKKFSEARKADPQLTEESFAKKLILPKIKGLTGWH